MALASGSALGAYEILSPIGKGGMGEVYKARDTKLRREVAIKVLPDEFSRDSERVSRFQREAEALAALNHANIAGIYHVEETSGVRFLVLELVDGETLEERLKRGPLPVDEAATIATQICNALEAAHDKGIIHRDLKPANIKITADGRVKLLDFGLARLFESETGEADLGNSPTQMSRTNGMILGTASYMSPEQARGQKTGRQSDIWAFGCVFYELLTARRAFAGETITDTLSAIIKTEPDWTALPETVPRNIHLLLHRCLQKDSRRRLHDIADARNQIEEEALQEIVALGASGFFASRPRILGTIVAAALFAAGIVAAVLYVMWPQQGRELRLQVMTPQTDDLASMAVSPDGSRLVFAASTEGKTQLWMRAVDTVTVQALAGTEGATFPFWSPDSRSLGFFANGKLKRIDLAGGPPRILANAPLARGGSWNRDGVILFAPAAASALYQVAATNGGEPAAVTKIVSPLHTAHRFPQFLPDGRHFIFNSLGNVQGRGVYVGSIGTDVVQRLFDAESQAVYVPPGYLVFVRQETLLAQRFNPTTFQLDGEPMAIAENVVSDTSALVGAFSSGGGILAYRALSPSTARQLVWFDRSGKSVGTVGGLDRSYPFNPTISPDGQHLALDRQVNGNVDIWIWETTRQVDRRFTVDPGAERGAVWSPDGSRIVFVASRRGSSQDLYEKPSSGGSETLLYSGPGTKLPIDWSQDGRFILYREVNTAGVYDLFALPMYGERKPFPIANTPFEERDGQFSPDVQWVAFRSNESGRFEVYVQPFPGPGPKMQVSVNGGTQPRWRRDGKELFYISMDSKVMAVAITTSADRKTISAGSPMPLFSTSIAGGPTPATQNQQYVVSADGQRFLVNTATDEANIPITVVLNWNPLSKK